MSPTRRCGHPTTGAPRPASARTTWHSPSSAPSLPRGYVKNKVMEFVGPGIAARMTTDYRNGVDVADHRDHLPVEHLGHRRGHACVLTMRPWRHYRELKPADVAYDGCVEVDRRASSPMIALPFHPSNGFEIDELNENLEDILHEVELEAAKIGEGKTHFSLLDKIVDGKLHVQQGVIAGCLGGNYDPRGPGCPRAKGRQHRREFSLSVYPTSQPVALESLHAAATSMTSWRPAQSSHGVLRPVLRRCGDSPPTTAFPIRHATRNFPNREGLQAR